MASTAGSEVELQPARQDGREEMNSAASHTIVRKRRWNPFKSKNADAEHPRRPPDNKWMQQQIPACRPVFTGMNAFVGFLIVGIAFIILGIIFTVFTARLREFEVFYENCEPLESDMPSVTVHDTCEDYLKFIANISNLERRDLPDCHCMISFTLPEDIRPPWNFYYGMRNYYQNHRRYLNSWDVNQLRGSGFRSPSADCRPITNLRDESGTLLPVVPCGLIANSWFNDSFDSFTSDDDSNVTVMLDRTNIAWETDRTVRFQNPDGASNVSIDQLEGTIMPPNWVRNLSEIDGGLQNESLIVWFRISAFPWFKKLYARPSVMEREDNILPQGEYNIVLTYNYPVAAFDGRKSIILEEVNWLGGRNIFLGVAYLVVGVILIVTAVGVLLLHKLCSNWKLDKAPFN